MTLTEYFDLKIGQIVEMDEGFVRVISKVHEPIPEMEGRYFIQAEIVLTKNFKIPSHIYTPWRFYKKVKIISENRYDKYISRLVSEIKRLNTSLELLKTMKNEIKI